jgi:hypothetical protein
MKNSPTHIGYYLHKDGTPIVAPITEEDEIKKFYYYRKNLYNDNDIQSFLNTYNGGKLGKRMLIKRYDTNK